MSFGDFTADRKTVYAVTRALEIISEASRLHRGNGLDRDSSGSQRVPARDEVVDETLVWYTVQHSLTDLHQASAAEVRRLAAAPV